MLDKHVWVTATYLEPQVCSDLTMLAKRVVRDERVTGDQRRERYRARARLCARDLMLWDPVHKAATMEQSFATTLS